MGDGSVFTCRLKEDDTAITEHSIKSVTMKQSAAAGSQQASACTDPLWQIGGSGLLEGHIYSSGDGLQKTLSGQGMDNPIFW